MSSGGANNSATGSPVQGGPATTTRRRVADLPTTAAAESDSNNSSSCSDYYTLSNDEEADNPNGYIPSISSSTCGSHYLHHHHHHHQNHHPVIRYLLLRRKLLFSWVPDTWFIWIERTRHWGVNMAHGLRSGRNMGRKIIGALLLMAVVSFFLKVSFLTNHVVEVNGKWNRENGFLILQTFKEDWALAQRVVDEIHVQHQTKHSMPKRVLERVSVSFSSFFGIEFCSVVVVALTKQRISTVFFLFTLVGCYVLCWHFLVRSHERYVQFPFDSPVYEYCVSFGKFFAFFFGLVE